MGRFTLALVCRVLLASCVATSVSASEAISYQYDALGRLISTSSASAVNNGHAVSITYDAAGNRTNYTVTGVTINLWVADTTVTEGDNLVFAVSLSRANETTVTVNYATSNGTATAVSDYTAASGTLTFLPREVSKTVTVSTINDSLREADETMFVTLSAPAGASISDGTATGIINDNDELAYWNAVDLPHAAGFLHENSWAMSTDQPPATGHMVYGPYTTSIPTGNRVATFRISIDQHVGPDASVLGIDVHDATAGEALGIRWLSRSAWTSNYNYQMFEVPFSFPASRAGHQIEFRIWYVGNAWVQVSRIGYC